MTMGIPGRIAVATALVGVCAALGVTAAGEGATSHKAHPAGTATVRTLGGASSDLAGAMRRVAPIGGLQAATSPPPDLPAAKVRHLLQSWRGRVGDGTQVPSAERQRLRRGITRYMPAEVTLELLQFVGEPKDGVLIRMRSGTPASSLQALEPVVSYVGRAGALGAFKLRDPSGGL